jgi:hypothetical protein
VLEKHRFRLGLTHFQTVSEPIGGKSMAEVTVTRMRKLWFQVHKWIGLLLALAIIPLSLSGAALVWHDWLDETLNPQRYAVSGEATLAPSAYVSAAKKVLPQGALIATLRYPGEHGPVMVNAVDGPAEKGRTPARINVWLDPPTARVLDIAGGNDGLVRFLHQLHGSFQIPGFGRQVVGCRRCRVCGCGGRRWAAGRAGCAGSGRGTSMPIFTTRWASGSRSRLRCSPSRASGFPSRNFSRA